MIIIDTCVFIWDALQHKKMTTKAREAISQAEKHGKLMLCDISLWEVAMLIKRKRLQLDLPAATFCQLALQARNIEIIPITPAIAEHSVNLDTTINNDPADRIIAASSIILKASLLTADQNLRNSPLLNTIW